MLSRNALDIQYFSKRLPVRCSVVCLRAEELATFLSLIGFYLQITRSPINGRHHSKLVISGSLLQLSPALLCIYIRVKNYIWNIPHMRTYAKTSKKTGKLDYTANKLTNDVILPRSIKKMLPTICRLIPTETDFTAIQLGDMLASTSWQRPRRQAVVGKEGYVDRLQSSSNASTSIPRENMSIYTRNIYRL